MCVLQLPNGAAVDNIKISFPTKVKHRAHSMICEATHRAKLTSDFFGKPMKQVSTSIGGEMTLMAKPAGEADLGPHGDRRGFKQCEATHNAESAQLSLLFSCGDPMDHGVRNDELRVKRNDELRVKISPVGGTMEQKCTKRRTMRNLLANRFGTQERLLLVLQGPRQKLTHVRAQEMFALAKSI